LFEGLWDKSDLREGLWFLRRGGGERGPVFKRREMWGLGCKNSRREGTDSGSKQRKKKKNNFPSMRRRGGRKEERGWSYCTREKGEKGIGLGSN